MASPAGLCRLTYGCAQIEEDYTLLMHVLRVTADFHLGPYRQPLQ